MKLFARLLRSLGRLRRGDLLVYGDGEFERLPRGQDGQVLTRDDNADLLVRWADAAGGGYTPGGTDVPVTDGGTGASTATGARTNLGLAIGSDVQAYSANLSSYAGTAPSAFGLSLIDDANASAARTTLGLAIGSDVQAYSANLASYAGTAPSAFGLSLVDDANAAAARTTLGLVIGTDVQAYNANLTSYAGTAPSSFGLSLIDDANAATARTTLGLAIGTDVQAYDADLAAIAAAPIYKILSWAADPGSNVMNGACASDANAAGTGGVSSDADSHWLTQTTSTSAGGRAGHEWVGTTTRGLCQSRHNPIIKLRFRTEGVSNTRHFIGLFESGRTATNADAFGGFAHIGIRYVSGTDTYWSLSIHDGGSNHTVTAFTGATPTGTTEHILTIEVTSNTSVTITLTIGVTSYTATVTTLLPASTTIWGWRMNALNQAGGATTPGVSGGFVWMKCR